MFAKKSMERLDKKLNTQEQLKQNQQEIDLSMEILTPIISTTLKNGEIVSSFVGKNLSWAKNAGQQIYVSEIYSVLAKNKLAEVIRKKYKKGMLIKMKGTLSYMKMKMDSNKWERKIFIASEIYYA
jgi:single-stranded DNA-binding protein